MKRIKKTCLALILLLSINAVKAQTVDEVIDKVIAALGGRDKLLALNSIKMEGTLSMQGHEIGITTTILNGKGVRTDIAVPDQPDGYIIITPGKGWTYLPFQGMAGPIASPEGQVQYGQSQLDLQSSFLDYAKKGHKIELMGKEKLDGVDCFKLKITYKNGQVSTVYIDANTYYRVKSISTVNIDGQDHEIVNTYADFKKTPEGYVIPFSGTTPNGPISFSSIEINKPVDENIFKAN